MVFLQAAASTLPDGTPWWAAIGLMLLTGAAGWFARRQDARDKARADAETEERKRRGDLEEARLEAEAEERKRRAAIEADERQWRRANEERHIKAQEVTAQALEGIRGTLSVMQFQISDIREHVGMARGPRLEAKARGRAEADNRE